MNKQRVAGRMATLPDGAPTPQQAAARRKAMIERERDEKRAASIRCDGMKAVPVEVKISAERSRAQYIRCRSGTFEWRFAKSKNTSHRHLFDAGNHLAQLWERAGMTVASSANFMRGITSGYSTGISDGRLTAMDKLDGIKFAMGHGRMERLIDYVVSGLTANEIATKFGISRRDIPAVLHQDLRDCWEVTFGPKAKHIRNARRRAHQQSA